MGLEVVRFAANKLFEAYVLCLDLDGRLIKVDKIHALLKAVVAFEEAGHEGWAYAQPANADVDVLPNRYRYTRRRCRASLRCCMPLTYEMLRAASTLVGMTSTKCTRSCSIVRAMHMSTNSYRPRRLP